VSSNEEVRRGLCCNIVCAIKNNGLDKLLYVGSGSVSLHQTFTLCILVRVFAQDVLKTTS